MNIHQIQTLNQHKNLRALLLNGVCIAERKTEDAEVLLFQLQDRYIEIFLTPDHTGYLYSETFNGTDRLKPYLE